jgi:hypothetical protein
MDRLLQTDDEREEPATVDTVTTHTLPAVMLGIASIIIMCSLVLYASDMRDRCRHERILCQRRSEQEEDQEERPEHDHKKCNECMGTSATSAISQSHCSRNDTNACVCRTISLREMVLVDRSFDRPSISPELGSIPPLNPYQETISLVSTLTSSLVESGGMSFGACLEERLANMCTDHVVGRTWGADITELSDMHRVPQGKELSKLLTPERKEMKALAIKADGGGDDDKENRMEVASVSEAQTNVDGTYISEDGEDNARENGTTSSCSSLTDGFMSQDHNDDDDDDDDDDVHDDDDDDSTEDASQLHGETCLKDDDVAPRTRTTKLSMLSLEFSPDRLDDDDYEEHRDILSSKVLFPDNIDNDNGPRLLLAPLSPSELEERVGPEDPFVESPCAGAAVNYVMDFQLVEYLGDPNDTTDIEQCNCDGEEPQERPCHTISFSSMDDIEPIPIEEYIRDVFFVPVINSSSSSCSKSSSEEHSMTQRDDASWGKIVKSLGLELLDASCAATHPVVSNVSAKSPLRGRVFAGDFIRRVNDTETLGFSSKEIAQLLVQGNKKKRQLQEDDAEKEQGSSGESTNAKEEEDQKENLEDGSDENRPHNHMVKLTVISSHASVATDCEEDDEVEDDSSNQVGPELDMGLADTAFEI